MMGTGGFLKECEAMAKDRTASVTRSASKIESKNNSAPRPARAATKAAQKSAAAAKKAGGKSASRAKKPPALLTTEQRRKLLRPREGFDELIERIARTWDNTRSLRVPGLTVARLLKLLRDAERSAGREQTSREKMERILRPLIDARL